jgi:protein disulfide-isomerase A6
VFVPGKKVGAVRVNLVVISMFSHFSQVQDYQGGRTASDIVSYAQKLLDVHGGPPRQIDELVSQQMFDEKCIQRTGICIISFLPHLLDENAALRSKRLATLTAISSAKDIKNLPVQFVWAVGGDQLLLEQTLGISFGYPAVVAISGSKHRFAIQRDAFGDVNIARFVKDIVNGKQSTSSVSSWPSLKTVSVR